MGSIVLFGQAPFGRAVGEGLLERGHEITAVCTPALGARPDPLAALATERGLRLVARKSYKGEEAAAEVAAAGADLAVLAFVTQIIPTPILDAPRHGAICFHPSLLPAYRGGSALAWQLIAGETRGGVTLFRPDEGVDTGPIYLQRELEIGPDESAGSFYYTKVFDAGVAATLDTVDGILAGTLEAVPQDEAGASHQPLCKDEHAGIDWTRSTSELHNLVRGCDPAPGAHARFGDAVVRFYGSSRGTGSGEPGTVLAVGEDGIEVATGDGSLRFAKMAGPEVKGKAGEVASATGLAVGAKLASA
jgi:methionyl-tRNA formyltransferase